MAATLARSEDTSSFHDSALPLWTRPPLEEGRDNSPGVVEPEAGGARVPGALFAPPLPGRLVAGGIEVLPAVLPAVLAPPTGVGLNGSSCPVRDAVRLRVRLDACTSHVSSCTLTVHAELVNPIEHLD